jgi:AcrR family transcriptional regulator
MTTAVEEPRPLRGSLSREDILAAGLRIARRSDLRSLNMRELARELGVTPMAIYHHYESKSALIEGIIDRYVTETAVTQHEVDKADWHAWLKRTFLNIYQSWRDAPGVQPVLGSLTHFGPGLLRLIDDTVGVLLKAGLPKTEALHVFSALTSLTMGHAILQTMRIPNAQYFERIAGERGVSGDCAALFDDYPHFRSVADELVRASRSESIEFELDLMLDSIGRLIARTNASTE